MSEEIAPIFVSWEEQVICPERGNRVTHFYLKDAFGNSVLAVVGTERSVRHMVYIVPDHFLQTYGSNESINAVKWRARREVVDWLTCLTSQNHPCRASDQVDGSGQAVESLGLLKAGIHANKKLLPAKMISRKLKFQRSDIEWSGIAWFCHKQLKHYPGFCRNGTTINVHSFVHIMAQEERHYLGYVEDMYEDKKRQKKVKVRWFYHGQEVKHMIPELNLQDGEVFITPHVQVISAECINGPATVLTAQDYEKYLAHMPHTSLSEVHMCSRQFKNNKHKPFSLTKLHGYSNQPMLSCLYSPILSKRKADCLKPLMEDDENFAEDDPLMSSSKRKRSSKGHQVLEKGSPDLKNSAPLNEMTRCEPKYPSLKLRLSRKTMGIKVIGSKPQCEPPFKVDEKIEILCQDSGIRGCWFSCKILTASQNRLKVRYDDVLDVDGPEKLEEWVCAFKVATPDKLGMRSSGRLTVRPCPPEDATDHIFEIGAAVDAWWSDGWWEGVVAAVNFCGVGILLVYSPGEDKFLTVEKKHIRISRDWVGNKWVDIPGKPNICSYISSYVSSSIRLSANYAAIDGSISNFESTPPSDPKVEVAEKVEQELSVLEAPDDPVGSRTGMTLRKPPHAIHKDKDYNCNGGCDRDSSNVDADMKLLCAIHEEDKDNYSGDGSEGDTDNDGGRRGGNDGAQEATGEILKEETLDSAEPKLNAAEAIQVV
ncbi:hypothetical protein Lal_00038813 [Lupinus albus]|uniref:Putative BAH domain, Agenet-like domain, Agenet domain, plant type n=1 Tax=Lupinus albus TaxID=3870 RepID=A0A6A5NAM1_LUPAL|nr:putative BAH domain, Agenet-like domain, Agenet domain, plant type [Lupinus albus]KAF1882169.1 hypothetical protein Lal_00038813 [Lupinus albus]